MTPSRSEAVFTDGGMISNAKRQLIFQDDAGQDEEIMDKFTDLDDLREKLAKIPATPENCIKIDNDNALDDALGQETFLNGENIILIEDVKNSQIGFSHTVPLEKSFYKTVKRITQHYITPENKETAIRLRTYDDKVSFPFFKV